MCVLKIYSKTKSFRDHPALDHLPVYSIHDKGDLRSKHSGEVYEHYRISLNVSDAEWDAFPRQAQDAIDFLTQHKNTLIKFLQYSDDIDAYLDFPLWSRLSGNIINQNDHLPKELIKIAGSLGLGIEMAIYSRWDSDDQDEPEVDENPAEQAAPRNR